MNQLVRELIRPLLEQEGVTALYGGGFKPPTKGHFDLVKKALDNHPEIDKFIIYVGGGTRDGIGQEQALEIWDIYKDLLGDKVEIIPSSAPIGDIVRYARDNSDEKVYFIIGAREGRDDDMEDVATRTKGIEDKYPNTSVKLVTTSDAGMSGTNARKAIGDTAEFIKYLPSELQHSEKEKVYNIVSKSLLKEHSMGNSIDLKSQIDRLTQHMIDKGYNIEPLPSLEFVDDDITNAEDFLGKTAYYNPDTQTIVLYTHGRHPKDIARSYAHEMIHHIQNLEGRLGDITTTNTQEDDKLNDLEAEANLKGTMTFRNWTDSLDEGIDNQLKQYIDGDVDVVDVDLLNNLLKFKSKNPKDLDPRTGGNKYGYRGMTFDKDFIKTLNVKNKSNGTTEYEVPSNTKITSKNNRGFLSFSTDEEVAKGFGHYSGYVDHNKSPDKVGGYVKVSLDNPNFILHPDYVSKLSQDLEYSKESEKETLYIGNSFNPESIYVIDKNWTDSLNENTTTNSYPFKVTDKTYDDEDNSLITVSYEFTTPDNSYRVEFYSGEYSPEAKKFDLSFGVNTGDLNTIDTFQITGEGNARKIFKTILNIVEDFINKEDVEKIVVDGTDEKRKRIYKAIFSSTPPNISDKIELKEAKNKDPFGLNQFARELMTEGAYDALTTKLTKLTINKWVADFKENPKRRQSFIDLDIEDVDGKGRDIEFNYVGQLKFSKKSDGYEVDGTSNSGEEKDKIPFIATLFTVNPKVLPQAWSQISADVSDVIRHELEHLTQSGENVRGAEYDEEGNMVKKGKYMEDDILIRDMINKLKLLPKSDYYKLEKEVDAMLQGLYLKAKKLKKPFADVINNYLDIAPGIETKEDKEAILNLWRNRRKALSLPLFEEEEVMNYTIYSDMDGVLSDFDKRFMEFSDGIPPGQYEQRKGREEFWKLIDDTVGVPFWAGMDWMSDGKEYWNYIEKYNPIILSAPSKKEESKYGKRIWKKRNMPNNKMILVPAWKKKEYATPTSILIDDRADNINQWEAAGGIGILHTDATSTIAKLKKLGL
jgi:hypothetical protein